MKKPSLKKSKSFYKRIFSYFSNHKFLFVMSIITAAAASGLQLLLPYLMGIIIDFIPGASRVNFTGVTKYCLIMAAAIVLAGVFQWFVSFIGNKIAFAVCSDIRKECMERINTYPVRFFDSISHGDTVSRISSDAENISDGILQLIRQLFIGVFTLVGSFVLMMRLNWIITLVVVALTPLAFLLSSFIVRNSNKMFKLQQQTVGRLNGFAKEFIEGQKTVKAYSMEKSGIENFEQENSKLYEYGRKAQFYSSLVNPCTRFINSSIYIIVGIVGSILAVLNVVLGGIVMSVGLIASFLAYALQFAKPINDITNVLTQLQTALVSFERVFAIMDYEPEAAEGEDIHRLNVSRGEIEFKNVEFSYDKSLPLIKGLNLHIPAGSKVAVVGPTGAGKTTLVNLLMRFYDAQSGTITLDSQNIFQSSRESVRKSFGMVLQDTFLFNDTIRANIAYGKPEATDEEVENAAREAYAHSFIRKLPSGYDTVISADAQEFSAGQKQLITIARAMLVNAPVLILDEATSSVDTLTELRIQKAFNKMMKGKTSFVIAHRLSTIVDSDLIIVMDKGNVVQTGTHEQLLRSGGLYSEIYNSQFTR